MTGDRFWWQEGMQYRDLAKRLREMARKCTLPNPQWELLVDRVPMRAQSSQSLPLNC
jgi:hypothetical protein